MISETVTALMMQLASLFLIACCIFVVSSLLASAAFAAHRKYVSRFDYPIKHSYLVLHACAAMCASIVVTVWLSLPHSPRLPFVFQHCHQNNCATHIPAILDSTFLNLLFAFFAFSMVAICFVLIKGHHKKLVERINSLLHLSDPNHNETNLHSHVTVITTQQPVILNVGMLGPKLLLSSQLLDSINVSDVKLLVAYEYSKAKQFENLKLKLVQIVCLFWPLYIRRLLMNDLRASIRANSCDEIHRLLGSQTTHIPDSLFTQMNQEIKTFIAKMGREPADLALPTGLILRDAKSRAMAYFLECSYFICLVVITSNFTHFLFEWIV